MDIALQQKMSAWFGNKTRAKVLKYVDYPVWLPAMQVPFAVLLLAAALGLTPGASGSLVLAVLALIWALRLGWCFFRIAQARHVSRHLSQNHGPASI